MTWHRRASSLTRAQKDAVLAAHHGVCHVCHHDGATQVDHIRNVARGGTDHPSNLAPIHGTPDGLRSPCPTCGQACHGDKTKAEAKAGRVKRTRRRDAHPGTIAR